MRIQLNRWSGRLGNNMQQLAKAIHLAKCVGAELHFPSADEGSIGGKMQLEMFYNRAEPLSNLSSIVRGVKSTIGIDTHTPLSKKDITPLAPISYEKVYHDTALTLEGDFSSDFQSGECLRWSRIENHPPYANSMYGNLHDIMKNDVMPIVSPPILKAKVKDLGYLEDDDTLVIHIRAGDVMDIKTTHPAFVQSPMCLATKVIKEHGYKNIVICSEDPKSDDQVNPVHVSLPMFCRNHAIKCDAEFRSVAVDAQILSRAKNVLIMGHTTFSTSLVLGSHTIKNVYFARHQKPRIASLLERCLNRTPTRVYAYGVNGYFAEGQEWVPTHEQKMKMLTCTEDQVFLHHIC